MAKNSVRDFDATAANNTDIQSVNIAEGCAPSGINNAIRELMADIKDVSAGTVALESPQADSLTVSGNILLQAEGNELQFNTSSTPVNKIYSDDTYTSNGLTISADNGVALKSASNHLLLDDTGTNEMVFNVNSGERMRIDSSGNVGIGTSSPDTTLHLSDTGSTNIKFDTGEGGYALIGENDGGDIYIQADDGNTSADSKVVFQIDDTERMRIDSSGTVLVGTTTSIGRISTFVGGTNDTTAGTVYFGNGGGSAVFATFGNTDGTIVYGYIQRSGAGLNYASNSDYRLKENVTDITDGITRLKLLNPSRFNFISDANTTVDGFLAHEVSDIVPEAITGEKDAVDADGNPDYQGIDQSKLVPLLTAALQEAITKIETLEAKVTALENANG